MKTIKLSFALLAISGTAAALSLVSSGCGSKDTDPHEKIDAPGYYNGPMSPHGGSKAGGGATGGATK